MQDADLRLNGSGLSQGSDAACMHMLFVQLSLEAVVVYNDSSVYRRVVLMIQHQHSIRGRSDDAVVLHTAGTHLHIRTRRSSVYSPARGHAGSSACCWMYKWLSEGSVESNMTAKALHCGRGVTCKRCSKHLLACGLCARHRDMSCEPRSPREVGNVLITMATMLPTSLHGHWHDMRIPKQSRVLQAIPTHLPVESAWADWRFQYAYAPQCAMRVSASRK